VAISIGDCFVASLLAMTAEGIVIASLPKGGVAISSFKTKKEIASSLSLLAMTAYGIVIASLPKGGVAISSFKTKKEIASSLSLLAMTVW